MANIAEGFERGTKKEFIQFLNISKGSNGETRSHLYVALDQEYIDDKTFNNLREASLAYLVDSPASSPISKASKAPPV